MSENIFHAPDTFRNNAWIQNIETYRQMYKESVEDPDSFWTKIAETFYWEKKWDQVRSYNYSIVYNNHDRF